MCHNYGDEVESTAVNLLYPAVDNVYADGTTSDECAMAKLRAQLRQEHGGSDCLRSYAELGKELRAAGASFCDAAWDTASCWPPTLAGLQAVVACPTEYRETTFQYYDTNLNATRFCEKNGTWANLSDYDQCANNTVLHHLITDEINSNDLAHYGVMGVYYVGYIISLVSACVALWVFFYFRTLHCLRNTLHCNLIITYILVDFTWVIMTSIFMMGSSGVSMDSQMHPIHTKMTDFMDNGQRIDCRVIIALFNYFQVTNFFWMLVEGLYIILIIFRTHKLEMLYYWPFALIGWGLPVLVIVMWVAVKLAYDNAHCWWYDIESSYNFIYIGPILFVLAVNILFLLTIMHVLLRKYRGTTTTAASTRRTAKSFLILLPLLGISYVLIMVLPRESGTTRTVLKYITAVFSSMQGFFVSLLYCFLNNEVRSIIRLRGNSFFPYRTWLKLDSSSLRRSPRTLSSCADNNSMTGTAAKLIQEPPALSRYRQNENLRQLHINTVTANRNELAYLLKEKEYQDRIQKQIRHQALGYRSTVF